MSKIDLPDLSIKLLVIIPAGICIALIIDSVLKEIDENNNANYSVFRDLGTVCQLASFDYNTSWTYTSCEQICKELRRPKAQKECTLGRSIAYSMREVT